MIQKSTSLKYEPSLCGAQRVPKPETLATHTGLITTRAGLFTKHTDLLTTHTDLITTHADLLTTYTENQNLQTPTLASIHLTKLQNPYQAPAAGSVDKSAGQTPNYKPYTLHPDHEPRTT